MINKTERNEALDQIHPRMVSILMGWMDRERMNLEKYIENPEGHVEYSPYIDANFDELRERLKALQGIYGQADIIYQYKMGTEGYTRSQEQLAIEYIPVSVLLRLIKWMETKRDHMLDFISAGDVNKEISPLEDYINMFTFNQEKFEEDLAMYTNSIAGVQTIIQYKKEQEYTGGN